MENNKFRALFHYLFILIQTTDNEFHCMNLIVLYCVLLLLTKEWKIIDIFNFMASLITSVIIKHKIYYKNMINSY